MTRAELDAVSNKLARRLRTLGVGPDVLVGIFAERSLEIVAAVLAVIKAGGAYVPLDPGYPRERIAFMLEDCQAPVLLTQDHLLPRIPDTGARVLSLDADSWSDESPAALDVELHPDHLAYMIYTSGSTGQPKGAMNSHRAIVNRLLWMQDRYRIGPDDVLIQKTPFSFDVSVWEFLLPMITGARLVVARPEGHKDAAYLARLIGEQRVTVCHFVPSMLQTFLAQPNLREHCATLRHVICSGEALTRSLVDRFFEELDCELHNLYGPTEAAIDVTHWTCPRDWDEPTIPIGRPVANTQIHILDEDGAPVPVGSQGQLYIAGVQVARGYHRREELTGERFVPDPFSAVPEARMYATGDLARWRPDGNVEFLGRMDHQVKVRGIRIELGEIESALERHPNIEQAVVLAREDVPGDKRLVAYVVPRGGGRVSLAELRSKLQEQLPDYMLPTALVSLEEIPLTANGKADRSALPPPSRERPQLDEPYVAPKTALETFIAERWSELIGVDGIGTRDRFFDLGGDSLSAAEFIRAMEQELGENIYIVSVFDAPTIAEYASFLERDYAEAVERRFGSRKRDHAHRTAVGRIDEEAVVRMQRAVPTLSGPAPEEPRREPLDRALFVLAPPRSGTTLLRVMLAGHPGVFAASELQLLGFHTLQERRAAFTGKFSLWLEGTIRVIMELVGCDADEATARMAEFERSGLTTKQFYGVLQEWCDGRMLVDKSPAYACDMEALAKAERDFDQPIYVHLVRHPYAMIRSFEKYHMDQVLFLRDHDFRPRELGELVWLLSHENIVRFLEDVPSRRWVRIRYEDLVARPEAEMRGLCETLGLPFHEDLATPYRNVEKKMVDGLHAVSAPMGDTNFLQHGRIDPRVAESWKGVLDDDFLSDRTWRLAEALGYERPRDPAGAAPQQSRGRRRASALRGRRQKLDRHRGKRDESDEQ